MSVEDNSVIDVVSVDNEENVILTISDHLEWDEANEHLLILQSKINSYLGAIESGELYAEYPDAKGRNICIQVVALHEPNVEGFIFLERVKETLIKAGYRFFFLINKS
jgi:hypothetical protein